MSWEYRRLDDIGDLVCHVCREKIGKEVAGLIQVNPQNGNATTALYHDKCWEELKANQQKERSNG